MATTKKPRPEQLAQAIDARVEHVVRTAGINLSRAIENLALSAEALSRGIIELDPAGEPRDLRLFAAGIRAESDRLLASYMTLVCEGAAIETASLVADVLREGRKGFN